MFDCVSLQLARMARSCSSESTQSPTRNSNCLKREHCLGFAARIVSGYLYDPDQENAGSRNAGSTHAWAVAYVGGAGWIIFDPTNSSVGAVLLICVQRIPYPSLSRWALATLGRRLLSSRMTKISYARLPLRPVIIQQAIWLYFRH
jgi:hypothetical protein